jgi:hypothetical protein
MLISLGRTHPSVTQRWDFSNLEVFTPVGSSRGWLSFHMFRPIVVVHWSLSQHGIVPTQARIWLCTAPPSLSCLPCYSPRGIAFASRNKLLSKLHEFSGNHTDAAALGGKLPGGGRRGGSMDVAGPRKRSARAGRQRGRSSLCDDKASDLLSLRFIGRCASACPGPWSCPAGRSTHPACGSQAATDNLKVCVALAQR